VPLLEDLLLRFRRVWAPPGPVAGQSGVPEDLAATTDDELRDLSLALAAIDENGRAIVVESERQAAAIISAAMTESARIVETARERAPRVRADRAASRVRDRSAEIERLLAAAARDADAIRARASQGMEPAVARVVANVYGTPASSEVESARVVGRR